MRWWLEYLFLQLEARWHAVDVYLARQRGDMVFAADTESRQHDCERRIFLMEVNRAYAR